jgi:transposase
MYQSFREMGREKAQKLMAAATQNPFQDQVYHSLIFTVEMHIKIVLQYIELLSNLQVEIEAPVKNIEETWYICS